ncbi:LuxR family transcriptional regulator [Kribbella sancticallisti]|uniref:LuxR family transcriptional regulator n=1 Tax=Kribbella sancticallisti TaxID=460087 RepID=A0ABN2DUW4_9ACTN
MRAAGVESEMEIAYGGLHQLCGRLGERLSDPRYEALTTAFGISSGQPPDRFVVGLAVLNLLTEVAEGKPLICLIDDAQWLDRISAQTLAFVARRLLAERVAIVFAVRAPEDSRELAGLPELDVRGLGYSDARALLDRSITVVVDEHVRDRFVAETRGNPLALIELPGAMPAGQVAGGFGLPVVRPLARRIEDGFVRRLQPLPSETRRLLLTAAAEPVGDAPLLWRAAERLGIEPGAAAVAESAGLIEIGARVRFRHPLIRSAVYRAASGEDRRSVHLALAEATDGRRDPDRRAWHNAYAAVGLDEPVAGELEGAAARAQSRGGVAAAAAFLARAAELTPGPGRRAERTLAAADAKFRAGEPDAAYDLLAAAEIGPMDDLQRARLARLRAQIVFAHGRGSEAGPLLLDAANQLEALNDPAARETYLEALGAAIFVGRLGSLRGIQEAAEAARAARPAVPPPGSMDLLLDGMATRFTAGYAAAVPQLRKALEAFRQEAQTNEVTLLRWLWLACPVAPEPIAPDLWDDDAWHELAGRAVKLARGVGALGVLPMALSYRAGVHLHAGEFAAAAALVTEAEAIAEATGNAPLGYTRLLLAAWRGEEAPAMRLVEAQIKDATLRSEGRALGLAAHVTAVLYNGLSRYDLALGAARQACEHEDLGFFGSSLAELIEAAVRSDDAESAAEALRQLEDRTLAAGTDWALGILARSRALLAGGRQADALYQEAIDRLGRTRIVVQHARAHLLYGEWLRREQRRQDARWHLRLAHERLSEIGATAFAERAGRELAATGATARSRTVERRELLTAQEAQIAHLAADGLTNQEIGTQLFLSRHTVEWHLRKVFTKLAISSRKQLNAPLIDAVSPISAG